VLLRAQKSRNTRLLAPRARRAHGVAGNAGDATLFAEEIQGLGRLLGEADDPFRIARAHSVLSRAMGPLAGIKILEFEAIGPAPFAGMLLADMGADVLVVDRPASSGLGLKRERWYDVMLRGKRSVTLDL